MTQRDTPTTEQVQAMIDAAPPGEGANIKSGEATGIAGEETQVDFVTPFASAPRVVITPRISNWDAWLTTVTASYFRFFNNGTSSSRPFHWIATTAGNT